MKNYQIIKEHPNHFELHDSKDGRSFKVAKSALKDDMVKKIKGLGMYKGGSVPKMADGGDVEGPAKPEEGFLSKAGKYLTDLTMAGANPQAAPAPQAVVPQTTAPVGPETNQPTLPQADIEKPVAAPAPAVSTQAAPAATNPVQEAQNLAVSGIKGEAETQGKIEAQMAKDIGDYNQRSQQVMSDASEKAQRYQQEGDEIFQQYRDGKVDPNRLWSNMSTGSKIGAGISVLLSGLLSGFGKGNQGNGAMQVINDAIDKDIAAQRENLGKQNSLLSQNYARMGNLAAATQKTLADMHMAVQGQIQQTAAKYGTPMAKAIADQKLAEVSSKFLPIYQQMGNFDAMSKVIGGGSGQGGVAAGGPEDTRLAMVNPKYVENRVVVNGKAYQAPSKEDAESLRELNSVQEPLKAAFDRLEQIGPAAMIPGSPESQEAEAIRSNMIPKMSKLAGNKTFRGSPEMVKLFEKQLTDPGSFRELVSGGVKRSAFYKSLQDDMDANFKNKLIGYKGYSSFKPLE